MNDSKTLREELPDICDPSWKAEDFDHEIAKGPAAGGIVVAIKRKGAWNYDLPGWSSQDPAGR
jgi:hypothetical protein